MGKKDKKEPPQTRPKKPTLREIYARSRRDFSAADLQKFTVVEEGIPLDEVIERLEKIEAKSKNKKAK